MCRMILILHAVDLVIKYSRGFNFREFREEDRFVNSTQNLAKIIIIKPLPKKSKNSRKILNFVKSSKIRNSLKFKHAKITKSTVYV